MAHLAADKSTLELKTVSYFNGHVKIVIELDVPKFSTLKAHTEFLQSKRIVNGKSAWSLLLHPLDNPDAAEEAFVSSVFVKHECLTTNLSEITAAYKISILDETNKRHLQILKDDTLKLVAEISYDPVNQQIRMKMSLNR